MQKTASLIIIFLLSLSSIISSQELYKEKVLKKTKQTHSYKVNDSTSLHFTVTYHSKMKKYEYKPYLVGKKVMKLTPMFFSKKNPKIIASHINANKCVLIYKVKKQTYIIDYDFVTQKASLPVELFDFKYDHILQKEDATIFLRKNNGVIYIQYFINSKVNSTHIYKAKNNRDSQILTEFNFNTEIDYVTTDKYIDVGSIKKGHSYIYDKKIFLTYDNSKKDTSYLLELDYTKEGIYEFKYFKNSLKNNRQLRSFVTKNLLFQFAIDYKFAELTIYDLESTNIVKSFTYTKKDFGPYNKYFYKKNEVKEVNAFRFFTSFSSFHPFSKYLPTIFITVNKGKNDSYIVESGHINGAVYSYYNHFDTMWMHQNMLPPPNITVPHFGPMVTNDIFEMNNNDSELKKTSFILALDKDYKKLPSIPTTILKKDKWKKENDIIEEMKENSSFKSFSTLELKNSFRYMFYHRRIKTFFIKEFKKKK